MDEKKSILKKLKLGNLSYSTQLLLLAIVLMVFVFLIIMSKNWSGSQVIKDIDIQGTKHIVPNEISILIRDSVLNRAIKDVNFKKLENLIKKNDFVSSAIITSKLNGDLKVEIEERIPKAYIVKQNGDIDYIDSTGFVMNFRPITEFANIPVITGIGGELKDSLIFRNAMYILKKIQNYEYFNLLDYLSEIRFNNHEKTFDLISNDFSLVFKIGRVSLMDEKLVKFHEILTSNFAKESFNKIKYIDLRWCDQIVVNQNKN